MTTQRVVTGAHYGLRDWLAQRITGLFLAFYTVYLLVVVLTAPAMTYGVWAGLFASPFMKVATLLAVAALVWHAWIGIRDIWMDYVKPTGIRLALEVGTLILLAGYLVWSVVILWRI